MPSLTHTQAVAVVDALRLRLAARAAEADDAVARELATALALLDEVDFTRADPVHLQGGGHALNTRLSPSAWNEAAGPLLPLLPWRYSYPSRADFPGLEHEMAWAELVGPIAPFASGRVCLGVTYIAPRVRYPEHAHPAVEVYHVLSGTARWTADGIVRERPPGSFILHPSNVVHAMETGGEPLLAAYTWTGDVHTLSTYSD